MNVKQWNIKQIDEMLSKENKYFFWLRYGRVHNSVEELAEYYIEAGGAKNFAERNKNQRPSH